MIATVPALTAPSETLNAVLNRMGQEAASFKQITANVTKLTYVNVLHDSTTESGAMWLRRQGRKIQMVSEVKSPAERWVGIDGDQAEIYSPKINEVDIYDLGKHRGLVDQFLLLGFGSSGKSLEEHYNVTVKPGGPELVSGQNATHLELVPKAADIRKQIEKVELWIPLDSGHPIQQKFVQPGGDYYLITYSDIKLNPNLPDRFFQLHLPANVNRVHPQEVK